MGVIALARSGIGENKQMGFPMYMDYVVLIPNGSPQQDLWLELHPNLHTQPNYYNAILNGVEIFEINGTNGNLMGPNPIVAPNQDVISPISYIPSSGDYKTKIHKAIIIGGVYGRIILAIVIGFFLITASRC